MSIHTYIPCLKKIAERQDILIERSLPMQGNLHVAKGDKVEPFEKIGECKVSYELIILGSKFKPQVKDTQKMVTRDELVGKAGKTKFVAPFNGYLEMREKEYVFRSEEKDFLLLPGVWGEVVDTKENLSVLIKTQSSDVHMPIATNHFVSGELIVFPNPGDFLGLQYLNNYLKSASGKIVYVGNTVTVEMITKAKELGVEAIVAGSCTRVVFDYAQNLDFPLGIFGMFGQGTTPDFVFNFLTEVSSRFVFFHGERFALQIPTNPKNSVSRAKENILRYVRKGLGVQVFEKAYFGMVGTVDRATKTGIFVQLHDSQEVIEVKPPNLLALE